MVEMGVWRGELKTRRRKWGRWAAVGAALLLAGLFAALRFYHRSGIQKELARLRAAGWPISAAELNDWGHLPPDRENAALAVLEAIRAHRKATNEFEMGGVGERIAAETLEGMEQYLERNAEALSWLEKAAEKPHSRYPIDFSRGAGTLLPHLSGVRGVAGLLEVKAIYEAEAGQGAEAVAGVRTGLRLAQTLTNEPIFVSETVRIACVGVALEGLEEVLNRAALGEQGLKRLQEELAVVEKAGQTAYASAIAGERALGIGVFELSFLEVDQIAGPQFELPAGIEFFPKTFFAVRRAFGLRELDLKIFLEEMDEFSRTATNEFPDLVQETKAAQERMVSRIEAAPVLAILSKLVLPWIGSNAGKEARLAAELRLARLALAMERYRLAHEGELPEVLERLVPRFIEEIPRNPFNGSAVRYEKNGTGYVLTYVEGSGSGKDEVIEFGVRRGKAKGPGGK